MKILEENGKLIFYPTGHINNTNAAEVEKEINDTLGDHPGTSPVVDATDLEYVSSAGLRVLMRIRNNVGALTVCNVSPDLYETFEVTGFTSLLNVEKVLRFISVEGLDLIGVGSHSEVYRLDDETILKVVTDMPPETIREEMKVSKQAFIHGIPTAISYDMVRTEKGYGEVYEMVRAESLPATIMADTENIDKYLKEFADMYRSIHQVEIGAEELDSLKDRYIAATEQVAEYLSKEELLRLREFLQTIPDHHTFVHGDFHMNNVMLQDGELVLIDMGESGWGSPLLDFAQTANAHYLMTTFYTHDVRKVLGLELEQAVYVRDHLFRLYFGEDDPTLERKLALITPLASIRSILIPFIQGWGHVQHNYDELLAWARKDFFPKVDDLCEIVRTEFRKE